MKQLKNSDRRRKLVGSAAVISAALVLGAVTGGSASAVPAAAQVATSQIPATHELMAPAGQPGTSQVPITAAAFKNPAQQFKPSIRWWWQAPLSKDESVREIKSIAAAGFGQVEIAYSAGAWATQDQRDNLNAVLVTARDLDVKVSMTMGAAWPVQTPNTSAGTQFVQKELQYGRADVRAGRTFDGDVPAAFDDPTKAKTGTTLVAVTVAKVLKGGPPAELLPVAQRPRFGSPIKPPATSTIIDPRSLHDVTGQVKDGKLTWTAPAGSDWIVFAFWQRDAAKAVTSAFEKDAAKAATEYLDANQIGAENTDAVKKVGATMFEDSLELNADSLFWGPDFQQQFQQRFGYSMATVLPLMFQHGMSRYWVPTVEPTPDFDLPAGDGEKVRNDYYQLLTDLYIERSTVFQQWAASTYGMQYKTQPAFGQDLEPIRSARDLARAGAQIEGESYNSGDRWPININNYGWREALDWQRVLSSGAHQANDTKISTELGAQPERTYQNNLSDYKAMMDKEWAAGFSMPYVHGFAYQATGSTWPGTARFGDRTAESWNDSFPQWSEWPQLSAYWARGTEVLQTGSPRVDVAIYRDGFLTTAARTTTDEGTQPAQLFDTRNLEQAGYSVEFADPVGLAEKGTVGRGVLFPAGPQYQALIIDERSMSAKAAKAVLAAARSGVRVVFVGQLPSRDTTYASGSAGDQAVHDAVAATLGTGNAAWVPTQADAAAALKGLGTIPRVSWNGQTEALTQTRQVGQTTYVYIYNPGNSNISFAPSINGTGRLSEMNLMTGDIAPVGQFSTAGGRTVVPTTLAAQQTIVYSLDTGAAAPVHVVTSNFAADTFTYSAGKLVLNTTAPGTRVVSLSNGQTVTVTATPAPRTVANVGPYAWNLTVDARTPTGTKTVNVPLPYFYPLQDWRSLGASIAGESGVGTYTGTITLPASWTGANKGVYLDLGEVDGTADVYLNGAQVGRQIAPNTRFEAGPFLTAGSNDVKIVVKTTLRNAVTQYNKTSTRTQSYGLLGPVSFLPYEQVTVWDPAKAPATTTITAAPVKGFYSRPIIIHAEVTAAGHPATDGYVELLEGNRPMWVAPVTATGEVAFALGRGELSVGSHRLTLNYRGSESVAPTTATVRVTVFG